MSTRTEIGDAGTRHVLEERWAPGPLLGWMGMNPSEAGAKRTDPTWMRWRGFSVRWGYGGQIAANPVPLRSPNPDDAIELLREVAAGNAAWAATSLADNLEHLERIATRPHAWVIGWGNKGAAMNDVVRCHANAIAALRRGGATRFWAFGLTAGGNPTHALARGKSRVPDDAPIYAYDFEGRRLGGVAEHLAPNDPERASGVSA